MFNKGDLIHHASSGLCRVEDITHLHISGADQDKLYYCLAPVGQNGSTVFTPVDNPKVLMRRAMNRQEAEEMIEQIPHTAPLAVENPKQEEQIYRNALRSIDCLDWISLIKRLHESKVKKEGIGKKMSVVEERYYSSATSRLHLELANAIGIGPEQVGAYIAEKIENTDSTVHLW